MQTITVTQYGCVTVYIDRPKSEGIGPGLGELGTTPPPGQYIPVAVVDGFGVQRRISGLGPDVIYSREEGGVRYYYVLDPKFGMLVRYRAGAEVLAVEKNGGYWGDYDDARARGLYEPGWCEWLGVEVLFKGFCPSSDPTYTIYYSDGFSYKQLGGGPKSSNDLLGQGAAVLGVAAGVQRALAGAAETAAESAATKTPGTALVPKAPSELGKWGEARLAADLGYQGVKPSSAFNTSLGKRFFDRLVNHVAHEAKAGVNVGLDSTTRLQALKDAELIATGEIRGAVWHFYQGAQQELLDFLTQHGIQYVVH